MIKFRFFSFFDEKKFKYSFKISLIIILMIIIINLVGVTYSRYESDSNVYLDAKAAYFVVDQGTTSSSIMLTDLVPSNTPFIYPINVYNYDANKRTDVNLEYTISFETTTNLPITIDVIANEEYSADATSIITSTETFTDGDMYYKRYLTDNTYTFNFNENQMNQYTIVVNFPISYKDSPDLYQGKIELIKVIIKAEQLV